MCFYLSQLKKTASIKRISAQRIGVNIAQSCDCDALYNQCCCDFDEWMWVISYLRNDFVLILISHLIAIQSHRTCRYSTRLTSHWTQHSNTTIRHKTTKINDIAVSGSLFTVKFAFPYRRMGMEVLGIDFISLCGPCLIHNLGIWRLDDGMVSIIVHPSAVRRPPRHGYCFVEVVVVFVVSYAGASLTELFCSIGGAVNASLGALRNTCWMIFVYLRCLVFSMCWHLGHLLESPWVLSRVFSCCGLNELLGSRPRNAFRVFTYRLRRCRHLCRCSERSSRDLDGGLWTVAWTCSWAAVGSLGCATSFRKQRVRGKTSFSLALLLLFDLFFSLLLHIIGTEAEVYYYQSCELESVGFAKRLTLDEIGEWETVWRPFF